MTEIVWPFVLNVFLHLATERPLRSSSLLLEPPVVDCLDYPHRTGGRVDYLLRCGLPQDAAPQDDATRSVLRQLAAGYELVQVSPQTGMARPYRRRVGF